MPIGIQRLNARKQPPTPHIIFIKPLPGPTSSTAESFLSRVAAISHPIMKAHHLSVMSLEEFEPNREFIGRNFNAGEVIQLVLRTHSGAWLSFRSVVMVMMHELAHCQQMNHSRAFWKVRNEFAGEMYGLWKRSYTGEGVWGRGRGLETGAFEGREAASEELPEHVCGGSYRSRWGKKRKRGGSAGGKAEGGLSYAERQQRRIAKKFGIGGTALGDDEEVRVKLENGKRPKGKPRVAGSMRGRELRAQAALARLGQSPEGNVAVKTELGLQSQLRFVKKEEDPAEPSLPIVKDEGTSDESDYEEASPTDVRGPAAVDADGEPILDDSGRAFIKVCADEDEESSLDTDNKAFVKSEMRELQSMNDIPQAPAERSTEEEERETQEESTVLPRSHSGNLPPRTVSPECSTLHPTTAPPGPQNGDGAAENTVICPACSLTNSDPMALLCIACACVLRPDEASNHWKCSANEDCRNSAYINTGDFGRCGVCGAIRS